MTPGNKVNILIAVTRSRRARVNGERRTASATARPRGSGWSGMKEAPLEVPFSSWADIFLSLYLGKVLRRVVLLAKKFSE